MMETMILKPRTKRYHWQLFLFQAVLVCYLCACKKLIEIPTSKNQIESNAVFSDSVATTSALLGIYFSMGTASSSVHSSFKYINTYTDDFSYTGTISIAREYSQSTLISNNSYNTTFWTNLYSTIYQCNLLIAEVDKSPLSSSAKSLFKGEALFLRSLAYYYLAICYGKAPLLLTADVNQNKLAHQATLESILSQCISDLLVAREKLDDTYYGTGKSRANKSSATALLARIYLYQNNWTEAKKYADEVINGSYQLGTLVESFSSNGKETILEFWNPNGFLSDASSIIPANTTSLPAYVLSSQLLNSFEATDQRKSQWISNNKVLTGGVPISHYYMSKYKNRAAGVRTEYLVCLRLAEQYLIRAEALAKLEQIELATSDLNKVRNRAGLNSLADLDQQTCLSEIAFERRREFFGEWGMRLADLKRRDEIAQVMLAHRPSWRVGVSDVFPIPINEINYNPNLIQNHGY